MVYKNLCILVLWTKVASALEGIVVSSVKGIWGSDEKSALGDLEFGDIMSSEGSCL